MSIITRYISLRLTLYFIAVLFAAWALVLAFDLMEQADQVLGSSGGDYGALLRYSALRTPEITSRMIPIATLLSGLITFGLFMRHRELVALWSSGTSALGLMRAMVPVLLLLVGLQIVIDDQLVPRATHALRTWDVGDYRRSHTAEAETRYVWLMSGNDIIRIPAAAAERGDLLDITIFERDETGDLLEQLDAAEAVPAADGWTLSTVTRYVIDPPHIEHVPSMTWHGTIALDRLPLLSSDNRDLSLTTLLDVIRHQGYGQKPVTIYETWLHARLASMFVSPLMVLIVVGFAQSFSRTGGFGSLFMMSLGVAFLFFIIDAVSLTLGEANLAPPAFAAWAPKVALVLFLAYLVTRAETSSA